MNKSKIVEKVIDKISAVSSEDMSPAEFNKVMKSFDTQFIPALDNIFRRMGSNLNQVQLEASIKNSLEKIFKILLINTEEDKKKSYEHFLNKINQSQASKQAVPALNSLADFYNSDFVIDPSLNVVRRVIPVSKKNP